MNNSIDRITLDVHKAVSQVILYWKRGDTARTIEAVLTDNGRPYVLKNCTVSFTAPGADEPIFHYCEIKDNRVIYEAAPIVTETARSILCEFRVIGGNGKVLTAPRFTIEVRDTVIDPAEVEESEAGKVGTLDRLIGDAAELITDVETRLENGEFNGKDGKDGVDGKDGKDGAPGTPGEDGKDFTYDDFTPEQLKALTGPAGVGIASIKHTGTEDAVNPNFPNMPDGNFVSDVYTITYTDGGTFKLSIPRGSRIYTGSYGGPGVNIGKDDGIILVLAAMEGDYFLANGTGHFWRKVSDTEQIWQYVTCLGSGGGADLSDDLPLMDGEASPGISEKAARIDHRHPTDVSRMASATNMSTMTKLDSGDSFIVYDFPEKTEKKLPWSSFLTLIKNALDSVLTASGVTDEAGTGYVATIPELEDDAVLALASDIAAALVNYYTKGETYSREEIDSRISTIPKFDIEVVKKLPGSDISDTTIYLVATAGDTENLFSEYIHVNGYWEPLGSQKIDLSGYATEKYVQDYAQPKGDYLTDADKDEIVSEVIEKIQSDSEPKEITYTEQSGGYFDIKGVWIEHDGITSKYTNYIPVDVGDKFKYTGKAYWQVASVLWFDASMTLLSYEQYGDEITGDIATAVVTAPNNASYVMFQSFQYGTPTLVVEYIPDEEEIDVSEQILKSNSLYGKKIVYDGDSICIGSHGGGGYAKIIADKVGGVFDNQAVGGGRLRTQAGSSDTFHSVVDNLENLPVDGDLYCFEGGINDYWTYGVLGTYDKSDYNGEVDKTTVCGALETIFRYALNTFVGKPICFVITHKIQGTAYAENANGNTFEEYRDAMVGICEKYSIPYYDAFSESGLNGWNTQQNKTFLTGNSSGEPDGCHPNEEGYKRYYVPQLLALFERIMPTDVTEPEVSDEPTYTNVLDEVGYEADKRISASTGELKDNTGTYVTGLIPVSANDIIYLKNVEMPYAASLIYGTQVGAYNSAGTIQAVQNVYEGLSSDYITDIRSDGVNITQFKVTSVILSGDIGFIRICANNIDTDSIITINEPIE